MVQTRKLANVRRHFRPLTPVTPAHLSPKIVYIGKTNPPEALKKAASLIYTYRFFFLVEIMFEMLYTEKAKNVNHH